MSFHLYQINELYTNVDGSIQFIELAVGSANGESFWQGQTLSVSQGNITHSFVFPTDLPNQATSNTTVLVATAGFANLGLVTPNFIVPSGFLFTDGGTVNFASADIVSYAPLPNDGNHSISHDGVQQISSPKNFAGTTGTLPAIAVSIAGTSGDDRLQGKTGNDVIDGGTGIDTVIFAGPRSDYSVSPSANGRVVRDNAGADGIDSLSNIERLQFADKNIAFDLTSAGNAGEALEFIAMLAFPLVNAPNVVGSILAIFDQGKSMHDICQLAIDVGLIQDLAGSSSNLDLAKLVFRNVIGSEASEEVAIALAENIQGSGGSMSQTDFLTTIAQLELNQQHINLVGLQTTGVEYV